MHCPVCQAKLPFLDALLAQTRVGTQCPKCWARLRGLTSVPPLAFPRKKGAEQRRAELRRRAA